ncbi:OmpA family protein [Desulforhopalus singaporensis]|uniref:Peptidoglycan-associated lipoprotein n=1 Tax=Desulforhopalus singaporensis TaxID=91360 RepID=A0A1H0VAE4_9BACT|nr:OmpA family protein [Desulforhopalus singaporensis]SDP75178.1 peptidoglycan-associated lipoprotein [Desulforhopalus singaporensis]
MKTKLFISIIASVFIGSLLVGGCSKKNVIPPEQSVNGSATEMNGNNINYPESQGPYSEENLPIEGTLDDSTGLTQSGGAMGSAFDPQMQSDQYKKTHGRSSANLFPVYFQFDQAGLRPEMTEILMQNADYLHSVPNVRIVIQGNCDDRGTSEYNLALGERRAINTRHYLINLGINPNRMRTVSFGEERPLFPEPTEEAYKLNRRVDFVIE